MAIETQEDGRRFRLRRKLLPHLPRVGLRNLKTALAATLCAILYAIVGRNPTFACIGAIFGMGADMNDSWESGANRLIGTVLGGVLGLGLFWVYLQLPHPVAQKWAILPLLSWGLWCSFSAGSCSAGRVPSDRGVWCCASSSSIHRIRAMCPTPSNVWWIPALAYWWHWPSTYSSPGSGWTAGEEGMEWRLQRNLVAYRKETPVRGNVHIGYPRPWRAMFYNCKLFLNPLEIFHTQRFVPVGNK